MHSRQLIEMAAQLAAHCPTLFRAGYKMPDEGIQQYWTASKCRQQGWAVGLKAASTIRLEPMTPHLALWKASKPVLEEVLASEVLTRIWAAVSRLNDQCNQSTEAEPIAQSVLVGQLEARCRVLTLLYLGQQNDVPEAVELNRLRRSTERWTDFLLGYLAEQIDASEHSFDWVRVKQFSEDLSDKSDGVESESIPRPASRSMLENIRSSLQSQLTAESPDHESNQRIARAMLTCFPTESFESVGLLESLWLDRMSLVATDTEGMIDQLLDLGLRF